VHWGFLDGSMIRQKEKYISSGLILLDYLSIIFGYLVFAYATTLLPGLPSFETLPSAPSEATISLLAACEQHKGLLMMFLLLPVIGLKLSSSYRLTRVPNLRSILRETSKPVLIMVVIFFFAVRCNMETLRLQSALAASLGIVWGLLIINRIAVIKYLKRRKGDDQWWTCVLILGTDYRAIEAAHVFSIHPEWHIRNIGFLTETEAEVGEFKAGYKVLGKVDDIVEVLKTHVVDCVFFAGAAIDTAKLQHIALLCGIVGVDFVFSLELIREKAELFFEKYDLLSLLVFKSAYHSPEKLFIKRATDIVVSVLVIILLLPLWIILPLVIRLESPGSALFSQVRVGRNGRLFRLFKFRSMVKDAESMQQSILHLNEMDGPVFKVKNDPRITRIGGFLRRTSLDEFPQFFNVLMGDMSLVGPRPPLPEEVSHYGNAQRKRLSIKPGITCLWQISGRNEIKFDEWMRLDLQYIDHWSLVLDLKILFKTVFAIFSRKGAR
jgi:exopolysaccharide biosynthesis polyprenyl glycosylphosphotransferase